MDWIDQMHGLVRQPDEWLCEVRLLVGTLTDAELDRLRALLRRGVEPTRGAVRRCLDRVEGDAWRR